MSKAENAETSGEVGTFQEVLEARFGRRQLLRGVAKGGGLLAAAPVVALAAACEDPPGYEPGELTFESLAPSTADGLFVAPGFAAQVLISWGDPVVPGAPAFDVANQTGAAQAMQAGFNHDYLDFRPLPAWNAVSSDHGLLWINHEYTDSTMMFGTFTGSLAQTDVELAAHGGTIVEVMRAGDGTWSYNPSSAFNRRITATTPIILSGPVAGDARVMTSADPSGTMVLGMLNNCGGGHTPWGTILTAEENFDQYFGNKTTMPAGYANTACATFGPAAGVTERKWETNYSRFDLAVEPNEILRFGWIVEIDPYDPASTPKKRTAMGRFKHEAASGVVSPGGKFVSYSGDDQNNQYIYKFVTNGTVNLSDRASNMDLLDNGTLYVAKFDVSGLNGVGTWLPLTFGTGPLVSPAFADQNDVLLRARQAAAALGATKMTRPEDIDVNPVNGKVYCVMTGNRSGETNVANPRTSGSSIAAQGVGHVIEITETSGDHAGTSFAWEILLLCGEPLTAGSNPVNAPPFAMAAAPDNVTWYGGYWEDKVAPMARPDNVAFDSAGYMFLTTDGQPSALQRSLDGVNGALYACAVTGPFRGQTKAIAYGPDGCEVTGPFLTPDDKSLFFAIQHPGVDVFSWVSAGTSPTSVTKSIGSPGSAWNTTPAVGGLTPGVPRSAALVLRRTDGKEIAYGEVPAPPVGLVSGVPSSFPGLAAGAAAIGGLVALRNRRMPLEDPRPAS